MNKKIKIFISLLIAFSLVSFLSPMVFLANSPKINTIFVYNLKNLPVNLLALLNPSSDPLRKFQAVEPPANLVFQPIAKGVQAAEDSTTNTKYMKYEKGTKVEVHTFKMKDGSELNIIVPVEQ